MSKLNISKLIPNIEVKQYTGMKLSIPGLIGIIVSEISVEDYNNIKIVSRLLDLLNLCKVLEDARVAFNDGDPQKMVEVFGECVFSGSGLRGILTHKLEQLRSKQEMSDE